MSDYLEKVSDDRDYKELTTRMTLHPEAIRNQAIRHEATSAPILSEKESPEDKK